MAKKEHNEGYPIGAELHRLGRGKKTIKIWSRHYARLNTAIRKACEIMLEDGEVGDLIEIFYKQTGLQIGTVRMTARGKVEMQYVDKWVFRPNRTAKEKSYAMTPHQALARELTGAVIH